ncbi:MAG: hypothetical protein FJW40_10555 [Acidobacteria bacterium]|nr:hypothetical protein [Acidobacteriota bacterium]
MLLTSLLAAGLIAQADPALNFLANHVDGREAAQQLPRYLKAKAFRMLDARAATVAGVRSTAALDARRREVRAKLTEALGGFPERTPLNARVTGKLDFATHTVEKLIFESQPGFHVTANLYLPKSGQAPHPAILFPLGHEGGAKAHEAWQEVLITFAKRGYVCLAWDTLGQGERIQMWDADLNASKGSGSSTIEHTLLGLQTLLMGDSLARYTIWDGIRALDYLISRPEVDPKRIGLTGNSGGGTHTSYLGALDDRFAAAAPSCYLTTWRRLLETIGPQDAEQCIPPSIALGLDHADFAEVFAPKPFLMLVAVRDFFSVAGARHTFAEAQRLYDSLGQAAKFDKFEADDGHGYTKPRRERAYRFFSQWLEGRENNEAEPQNTILGEPQLWATRSGQVVEELKGETVHSLNLKRFAALRRGTADIEQIRRFTGFAPPSGRVAAIPYGSTERRDVVESYTIEKYLLPVEPGLDLPALLYLPAATGKRPATLLAWGAGKAQAHGAAARLAASGRVVLSMDLRGLGETRPVSINYGSDWGRFFGDYESSMTALLTGKALVIQRAEDIARGVDFLAGHARVDAAAIAVEARELGAVPALYATVFDRRITGTRLERMVESYEAIIRNRLHRGQWENIVTGALKHYDLPDLVRLAGAGRVRIAEPLNPLGQPIPAR